MIGLRMKMIRQCKGWKQSTVAEYMNITQQAYSYLEQGNSAPRIDTLTRFCNVFNIQINFLLASDVPVTEENITKYGNWEFGDFIREQNILEQKKAFLNKAIEDQYFAEIRETRLKVNM
jgi:transcriptional regulator with XRE-family HTH domain